MARYDYVTVGHVTCDVLAADGRSAAGGAREVGGPAKKPVVSQQCRPGGSAFYSALQAARLGLRTLIRTRGVPAEIEELLAPFSGKLDLEVAPAEHTTTLLTSGNGPARRQRLLAWAGPIEGPIALDAAILHLAPVARETPRAWEGRAEFVGVTPQGLLRRWNAEGEIALAPPDLGQLPERCDAVVLSTGEYESCSELLAQAQAHGALLAVTAGAHPTTLHQPDGERLRVPVPPLAELHDELGAGDVFAAALFVALHEGQPPAQAAAFANAAAAVRIAGVGPDAIGRRAAIEARLSSSAHPSPSG